MVNFCLTCSNSYVKNQFSLFEFSLKLLSRTKAADDPNKRQEIIEKQKKKLPELEDFLQKRDYSGAVALLDVIF
jgi:hypothetical protein